MKITRFGPESIVAGDSFLPRPSGENCLWIEVDQAVSKFARVLINQIPLRPDISESGLLLTVCLHSSVTLLPGVLQISVKDLKLESESQKISIQIHKSSKSHAEQVQREILTFWQQQIDMPETFRGWGLASMHTLPWKLEPRFVELLQITNRKIEEEFQHGRENFLDLTLNPLSLL